MIWILWDQQAKSITDVKIGDADAGSYKYESMTALLASSDTIKKDKHINLCHDQRKYFPPFVFSDDGMLEKRSLGALANLGQIKSEKMD